MQVAIDLLLELYGTLPIKLCETSAPGELRLTNLAREWTDE